MPPETQRSRLVVSHDLLRGDRSPSTYNLAKALDIPTYLPPKRLLKFIILKYIKLNVPYRKREDNKSYLTA